MLAHDILFVLFCHFGLRPYLVLCSRDFVILRIELGLPACKACAQPISPDPA